MKVEKTLDSGFHKEGPFVKALDVALASFNVHIVGNHVHKVQQFSNTGVSLTKLTISWLSAL